MSEFVEWIVKYGWRVVMKAFYIPADYFQLAQLFLTCCHVTPEP